MSCVVNGLRESKYINLGISLPEYGEESVSAVYKDGKYFKILQINNISEEFKTIIDNYVRNILLINLSVFSYNPYTSHLFLKLE
ncbi:hypothetical protein [Wolbachia endosymbiont of Onchocerca gibsoni]|uniref:hypothetical protein n=1 Tax=Wolbachia endosymbiont of Onchocerca gibsoni TaxID=118986 RepID=UPI0023D8C1CE|nr:hypothetical protein [Wolbachia endosymbiont of Onchocerca gibsoni]